LNIRTFFEPRYYQSKKAKLLGLSACCLLGALLWLSPAHARISIHVRGVSAFEGIGLSPLPEDTLQVSGVLKDELGSSIGNTKIRIGALSPSRTRVGVEVLDDCTISTSTTNRSGPDRALTQSDIVSTSPEGRFCIRVRASALPRDHIVVVQFDGSDDYIGTKSELKLSELRIPFDVRFDALSHTISLDEETTPISISVNVSPNLGNAQSLSIPLALWIREPNSPGAPRLLHRQMAHVGDPITLLIKRELFGTIGPAELELNYEGNDRFAPFALKRKILRVTTVSVEPLTPPTTIVAGDPLRIDCQVRSHFGVVTSGAIELVATETERTLTNVNNSGLVSLVFATNKTQNDLNLKLRFIPTSEGYLAPPPTTIKVAVVAPSPWRFTGWAVAGILVLSWFAWSRRQAPLVLEEPKRTSPPPPRAHIEVIGPTSNASVGWEGLVVDAHEGQPLAKVRVALVKRGFDGSNAFFEVHSDESGSFSIPRSAVPEGTSCELSVEVASYTPFKTELPPPGRLKLFLVSTRRAILDRLVSWTKRRGLPFRSKSEPTPDWVASIAHQRGNRDVELWAQAVSEAAFGPNVPLDVQRPDLVPPSGQETGQRKGKTVES
jgi:hypothetical protein